MSLVPATPFETAAVRRTSVENLWVELEHEGVTGWGEAPLNELYGQTPGAAEAALRRMRVSPPSDPLCVETYIRRWLDKLDHQRAAVAAVDAALHDWIGKRLGLPTWRWLGIDRSTLPLTAFTLGIAEPDQLRENTQIAAEYPIFKVKIGGTRDAETLRLIRSLAPRTRLRLDANGAWTLDEAMTRIPPLLEYDIEFIEQPVAADNLEGLRAIRRAGFCPIVADESCQRASDLPKLAGCVDGVNIKLAKCGGIREALRMIHTARALGLKVMLGCMVESSLGIAAAAQLAPLADWLDLDGHLLIRDDPFIGIGGLGGRLTLTPGPGLGVSRRPESAQARRTVVNAAPGAPNGRGTPENVDTR